MIQKLEVGKTYRTRNGAMITIKSRKASTGPFPFTGSIHTSDGNERSGQNWTKMGRHQTNNGDNGFDIVEPFASVAIQND
jgi:hypothetical protein